MVCKLEKLDLKFAEALSEAIGDKRVQDNLRDLPYPYTVENAKEFITAMQSSDGYVFVLLPTVNLRDAFPLRREKTFIGVLRKSVITLRRNYGVTDLQLRR